MATIEDVEAAIDRDNDELRAKFVALIPCLTRDQLIDIILQGHPQGSSIVTTLKEERRIFSIEYEDDELFPAFQFRNGAPDPVVGKILKVLSPDLSRWNVAFWWVTGNGWIEGAAAPAACLDQPTALFDAAERTHFRFIG